MLGKLLKYEFKATGRILLPVYVVLIAISFLVKITVMNDFDNVMLSDSLFGIMQAIIMLAYGCILGTTLIVTVLLLVQRFYKNLLRDEGYLMHTLPVAPWQNIMAKLIPAVLWSFISIIMAVLSMMLIGMDLSDWAAMFGEIGRVIQKLTEDFGPHWVLLCAETVVLLLIMMAQSITQAYMAMALGHLAHKNRILWSVAAYIGVYMVINFISLSVAHLLNWSGVFDYLQGFFVNHLVLLSHCMINGSSLVNLLFCAVQFAVTNYILKRRLNLE